jgi:hypothetical protein
MNKSIDTSNIRMYMIFSMSQNRLLADIILSKVSYSMVSGQSTIMGLM